MEEQKKFTAVIERGDDGEYSVYIAEADCPFGCVGTGKTVDAAKKDFKAAVDDVHAVYAAENKEFPKVEFAFAEDLSQVRFV